MYATVHIRVASTFIAGAQISDLRRLEMTSLKISAHTQITSVIMARATYYMNMNAM